MAEKKAFDGVSLILNLKSGEKEISLPFFASKADATMLYSAARIDNEAEKSPAKYVAFKSDYGFDIRESKALAEAAGKEKGALIGKVYAHAYKNAEGKDGVLLSGGFNPDGLTKGDKIKDAPFQALGSFTGPGARPVLDAMVAAGAAAKAKREAGAEEVGAEADAAPAPKKSSQPDF